SVDERDEDVRRLQVPVDDCFLVGVLDALADLDEKREPVFGWKLMFVAVLGDREARDVLHDEVRPPFRGGTTIEDPGDRWMPHERKGLSLCFKPSDDLLRVHPRLDEFESHLSVDRLELLGSPHLAHSTLTNEREKPVRPDSTV